MDRSDVIKLISVTRSQDSIGQYIENETEHEVFCSVSSISASEFFLAGQNGIKAALKFTMFAYDYNGEETLVFDGKRYGVYRTYKAKDDSIELYAEMKVGKK